MSVHTPAPAVGPTVDPGPAKVRFGDFVLDLERSELVRDGKLIPLRPQATRALVLLVQRAGHVVPREELRRALWSDTTVGWDQGMNQVIRQIRRSLGDDARNPRFVETVSRRGYRFGGSVTPLSPTGLPIGPAARFGRLGYFGAGVLTTVALPVIVVLVCVLLAAQ